MINHCSFGHRWVERGCMECLIAQIDELRSRLQALEQNTVPSGSAKQKPREWLVRVWANGDIQDINDRCFAVKPYRCIRVREVLDD